MYKINNKIWIVVFALCIVLLSGTQVFADEINGVLSGEGTETNPYILDGSKLKIEMKYDSLPVYYQMTNIDDGTFTWSSSYNGQYHVGNTYKINYKPEEKMVVFTKIEEVRIDSTGNTTVAVMIPRDRMTAILKEFSSTHTYGGSFLEKWIDQLEQDKNLSYAEYDNLELGSNVDFLDSQLGITYIKEENIGSTTPKYEIKEIVTYNCDYDIKDRKTIGYKNAGVYSRKLSINNVVTDIATGIKGTMADVYYFTSSKDGRNAASLFVPQYYRNKLSVDGASMLQRGTENGASYIGKKILEASNTVDGIKAILNLIGVNTSAIEVPLKIDTDLTYNVTYVFYGYTNSALNDTEENNTIEALISRIFIGIGDGLVKMLQKSLGKNLTIDGLIFNKFDKTKIDLYSDTANPVTLAVRSVVNPWYKAFSIFAYVCYVVILVYIGLNIMLMSGTQKQEPAKKALGNWFVGLVILFAVPTYVLPNLIKLNDAFVRYIGANTSLIESYYNYYDPDMEIDIFGKADILGGDSATISIEELTGKKEELEKRLSQSKYNINETLGSIAQEYSYVVSEIGDEQGLDYIIAEMYGNYKKVKDENGVYLSGDAIAFIRSVYNGNYGISISSTSAQRLEEGIRNNWSSLLEKFEECYDNSEKVDYVNKLIESSEKPDLMGTMRAWAGRYRRLVFVVVWWALIFQLIALTFIYYKRIFVLALLIAIFPIIMIFYCIDKMADGKSQTLSMWFKEVISNIYIQSAHAVIYVVLVETGLKIYQNDTSNWLLFFAAMLMIIPTEKIIKEIFGLNGSTLGELGGMAMKAATMIGTGVVVGLNLGRGLLGLDQRRIDNVNKKNDRLQRRQNKADNRKKTMDALAYKHSGNKLIGAAASTYGVIHKAGTNVRKAKAAVNPALARVGSFVKNNAVNMGGLMYGLAAGGSPEDMLTGAVAARALLGKRKKRKGGAKLKRKIESAYYKKGS